MDFHPDITVVEVYWLTDIPAGQVSSPPLCTTAKSRCDVENEGFGGGKTCRGLEYICHHYANSLLIGWLPAICALAIERL